MSTIPTVLHTEKEYGMIMFVPIKKKTMTRTTSRQDIFLEKNRLLKYTKMKE
jgi:hypothetical protein